MLNWGDKDAAEKLALQLKELLRERTMTFDQVASCYSIKHGESVNQRLKDMSRDRRPMLLSDFLSQMNDSFELIGKNQVKARIPQATTTQPALAGNAANAGYQRPQQASPLPSSPSPTSFLDKAAAASTMRYSDVSRNIQSILKESSGCMAVKVLEKLFLDRFATSIGDVVGISTAEYLHRKENIFDYNPSTDTVCLKSGSTAGPAVPASNVVKDEAFIVKEFETMIEAMGPVVYISTLCGKFIQRNGVSVTSVTSARPLDLFRRNPGIFLMVGAGNVTLKRFESLPEVQKFMDKPSSKAQRMAKAAEEAQLPVPEVISERHVVEEFRRLILADGLQCVYISSLCGRFLQRFKKPVTGIINCKPAEFLRRYPDIFVMTGGGNVGLREVLGPDAVSVPPPPPRMPKSAQAHDPSPEDLSGIELTDDVYREIHAHCMKGSSVQAIVERLTPICQKMKQASFLALEEVVLGGAAGKGLFSTSTAGEVVLFVRQLPFKSFCEWLPHILETLAPVMEYQLATEHAEHFKVEKDHVSFTIRGGDFDLPVKVFLSPVFKDRAHLLACLHDANPAERSYFYPAMIKERNEFVSKESEETKVLIQLMSIWLSKLGLHGTSAPTDWMFELLVIHICRQLKKPEKEEPKFDMAEMVINALETFAHFETLKVSWVDTKDARYAFEDIWKPLLSHTPLLMDPLNPFCNLADMNCFDSRRFAAAAGNESRLLTFQREAARIVHEMNHGATSADEDEGEDYDE